MVAAKETQIMLFRDGKRVVRNGAATNDLVLSAYADGNEHVFPRILDLYVKPGSVVADVTYRLHRGSLSANKLLAAWYSWKLLRTVERIPVGRSLWLFGRYLFAHLKLRLGRPAAAVSERPAEPR